MPRQRKFLLILIVAFLIIDVISDPKTAAIQNEVIDEIEQSFIPVSNSHQLRLVRNAAADNVVAQSGEGPVTALALAEGSTAAPETDPVTITMEKKTEQVTEQQQQTTTTELVNVIIGDQKGLVEENNKTDDATTKTISDDGNAERVKQLPEDLALYLGIAAACLVGLWLILGPIICLILNARRKCRQRRHQEEMANHHYGAGNSNGSWKSKWSRNIPPTNRGPTPPRDEAAIPLHTRRADDNNNESFFGQQPQVVSSLLSQPYSSPAMTTFSSSSDETRQLVNKDNGGEKPRSTLRTDI